MNMRRTQICLTPMQSDYIKKEAKKRGIPMAELIRRILDDWRETQFGQKKKETY